MILAIRTDKVEAELYLISSAGEITDEYHWEAGRTLADTLLTKINQFLESNNYPKSSLTGVAVFTGQGSYTGLRIGTTIANALAYALNIPVVCPGGDNWLQKISKEISRAKTGQYVTPEYDGEPNITNPK